MSRINNQFSLGRSHYDSALATITGEQVTVSTFDRKRGGRA